MEVPFSFDTKIFFMGLEISKATLIFKMLPCTISDVNVSRAMAGYFLQGTQRYDNTLIYLKGAFLALQGARVEQEGIAVAYPPYPANNVPVVHINIDDPAGNVADLIGNEITEGSFVVILNRDFRIQDLDIVYWLACPGRRRAPAAVPQLANFAIHFPAVRFCVLRKGGDQPAVPAPGNVSPTRMWLFLQNFALARAERDYFVAGVYEAALLVNGNFYLVQQGDQVPNIMPNRPDTDAFNQLLPIRGPNDLPDNAARYEWLSFVSPTLEGTGDIRFPAPREYNFLHRCIGIVRTEETKFLNDYVSFGHGNMAEKLLYTAVFSGFYTIFVTTVLHTFNVKGGDIQMIANRNPAAPPMLVMVAETYGFFRNSTNTASTTAFIYTLAASALTKHVGGEIPLTVFSNRSWNLPVMGWDFPVGPFQLASPHHPPRFGNPLAILPWLDLIPSEWGIIDQNARVDFRKETTLQGGVNDSGWYATHGD